MTAQTGDIKLADIAPRLARAAQDRRYELAVIDGYGFNVGDEFHAIIRVDRSQEPCTCGAQYDVGRYRCRLLAGCNAGTTVNDTYRSCPSCCRRWSSHR